MTLLTTLWRSSAFAVLLAAADVLACQNSQGFSLLWPARGATDVPRDSSVVVALNIAPNQAWQLADLGLRVADGGAVVAVNREQLAMQSNSGRMRLQPVAALAANAPFEVFYSGSLPALGVVNGVLGQFSTGTANSPGAPASPVGAVAVVDAVDLPANQNPVCGGVARVRRITLSFPDAGQAAWLSITEGDAGVSLAESPTGSAGFLVCDPPFDKEIYDAWRIGPGVHEFRVTAVSPTGAMSSPALLQFTASCDVIDDAGSGPADAGSGSPPNKPGCSVAGGAAPWSMGLLLILMRRRRERGG